MKLAVIIPLLFSLFSVPFVAAEESSPPGQLGFLDEGQALTGPDEEWKERVDTLAGLGFTFIATTGEAPAAEIRDYLEARGLSIRQVFDGAGTNAGGPDEAWLRVLDEAAQKTWAAGAADIPVGSELLWADDGAAEIATWPFDTRGFRMGVLLHAGGARTGLVQDPYPDRIGETLAEATKRGLGGLVVIAAPSVDAYLLNLEAAAAAHRAPQAFDGDAFYNDWATRRFGADAAESTAKSLKILHGAHKHVDGFNSVTEASLKILGELEHGRAVSFDMGSVSSALELSRRSRDLAAGALQKVPDDRRVEFENRVIRPAGLFVQGVELLETLSQLGNAWKIHSALPSEISRQRIESLVTQAHARSMTLRTALGEQAGGLKNAPQRIEALSVKMNGANGAGATAESPEPK